MNLSQLLKYAVDNDILDLSCVKEIEMSKRKEYLKKHPYSIYLGKDNFWHTYLPNKEGGRKAVKKKNQKDLENIIISYWELENQNKFKQRYEVWVERQKICGRSDNTIYKYQTDYNRFFKGDEFENMDIRYITDEDIMIFIKRLLSRKDIPYKALKAMFGYMSGVFEKAMKDKIIKENPCIYIDLPVFKKHCKDPVKKNATQRTLSVKEKKILLNKVNKSKSLARYAAELAFYTGMRVGELSSLKWSDIDFTEEVIMIQSSEKFNRLTKEYYISDTKNEKIRTIPLTDNMKSVLYKTKKEELCNGWLSEFVFSDENGRVHAPRISDWVRNNTLTNDFSCTKSIHAIRRTLNSNMRCNGVSSTAAAAILGHTEKVNEENYTYGIISMEEKKKMIEYAAKIE